MFLMTTNINAEEIKEEQKYLLGVETNCYRALNTFDSILTAYFKEKDEFNPLAWQRSTMHYLVNDPKKIGQKELISRANEIFFSLNYVLQIDFKEERNTIFYLKSSFLDSCLENQWK